jgi:hypothetical protein
MGNNQTAQTKKLFLKFRDPNYRVKVKEGYHGERSEGTDKEFCGSDYPYRGFIAIDNCSTGYWETTSKIGHLCGCELSGGEPVQVTGRIYF